jgi:membrane protein implicated in regulation of membrane protease activity
MRRLIAPICFVITLTVPTAALAYVGPGAGLSLLGALWALIAALATAFLFVIAWPVRKALRRRRAPRELGSGEKHADPTGIGPEESRDKTNS